MAALLSGGCLGSVVTDSCTGRLMGAVVEPDTYSMTPTATAAPSPATTAASMVDLRWFDRPKKFDGTDKRWLELKHSFSSVMDLQSRSTSTTEYWQTLVCLVSALETLQPFVFRAR
eukprot:16440954-Heterocapsa_arctica.AAC.1